MSAISTILARLRAAIWAIDVRDDIANAIEQCYSDVSNPTLKTEALEAALQNKIDEGEMAALTIGDGTITGAKLANGTIPKAKLDPSITFDADPALDTTSTNAIQNKVVAGAISTLQADLGAQTGIISLIKDYYIKTSDTPISLIPISSSAGRMYAVVDCTVGDKFVINAYSDTTQARAWCFIDSANNAISMADGLVAITDTEITAPANASKLIINDMTGGTSYKVGSNLANRIAAIEKGGSGLSQDARAALLTCLEHVAWIDEHGQTYYNTLRHALYHNQYWDYEWSAASEDIPSVLTYNSAEFIDDGTTKALRVLGGNINFDYVGDCEIEIEAKWEVYNESQTYLNANPQFIVIGAEHSDGSKDGFKVYCLSSEYTRSVVTSVTGSNQSLSLDGTSQYHTYSLKYIDGQGTLTIDGEVISSGTGVRNNRYLWCNGIYDAAGNNTSYGIAIKTLKFKEL